MSGGTDAVEPARENLTYEQFGTAVRELAQTIADDGYVPDVPTPDVWVRWGSCLLPSA